MKCIISLLLCLLLVSLAGSEPDTEAAADRTEAEGATNAEAADGDPTEDIRVSTGTVLIDNISNHLL